MQSCLKEVVRHRAAGSKILGSPAVNLIDYSGATRNAVDILEVLSHPFNEVIFVDPFYYLMQ